MTAGEWEGSAEMRLGGGGGKGREAGECDCCNQRGGVGRQRTMEMLARYA